MYNLVVRPTRHPQNDEKTENLVNHLYAVFCYRGGAFLFSFNVSPIYPHEAPKVKCKTKVGSTSLCI